MSDIVALADLTPAERAQFDRAVAEGDSGAREWMELMLVITVGSSGNGEAYERRQAVRALYAAARQ